MISLSLLLFLNFGLGLRVLRELQVTDRITNQHYEVSQWVRSIETSLLRFEISGIQGRPARIAQSVRQLEAALRPVLDPQVTQPELRARYREVKARIRGLVKRSSTDPGFFSDPRVLAEFESIHSMIYGLSADSEAAVRADRALNEELFRSVFPLLWAVFLISLLAVVWRYGHFKRNVVTPALSLIELIDSYRKGNLDARWKLDRPDVIGDTGRTLNHLFAELSQRRRERINFIGSVAHDIKNPLTAIGMSCDLLIKTKASTLDPQTLGIVERVRSQVIRLHRLTEDLLVAAKENRPAWQNRSSRFSASDLAAKIVEFARASDPKHEYSFRASGHGTDGVEMVADPDRITQVLTNLVSNAAKYSPAGTEIEVEVGRADHGTFIEVKDRGIGIPDEKKTSVFQEFNRLASGMRMSSGTGLGLAIVKDIVESYSGSIRILDRQGGGTCFHVELPDKPDGVADAPETKAAS